MDAFVKHLVDLQTIVTIENIVTLTTIAQLANVLPKIGREMRLKWRRDCRPPTFPHKRAVGRYVARVAFADVSEKMRAAFLFPILGKPAVAVAIFFLGRIELFGERFCKANDQGSRLRMQPFRHFKVNQHLVVLSVCVC